jgi:hypothetical protein
MKRIIFFLIFFALLSNTGCDRLVLGEIPSLESQREPNLITERSLLTYKDLTGGFVYDQPIDESALTPPVDSNPPLHIFEGRLELVGLEDNGDWQIYYGGPLVADQKHLPPFDFDFVQQEGYLVPVQRGQIITDHPSWNIHLEPGRVWSESGDQGYSRASFPFALTWKGSNAVLNGTMTFLFNDREVSKVWYQTTQETTISTSLDMWGLVDAVYHPGEVEDSELIKSAFSTEMEARFPTKPIESLVEDYPGVDLESFGAGLSPDHLTWFGFLINGVQYLGGCQTRYGTYPYCESMRIPSYSTAKSAFASLGLMRLNQKYNLDASSLLIKDYLAEAAVSPGDWEMVSFDHALDMATGNFHTSQRMADEEQFDSDPFWLEDYYTERIQAAFNWPNGAPPGSEWVYRTSDTFILTAAMQSYLRSVEGEDADIFQFVVDEIYRPLDLGPGVYSTVRTKDDNWGGCPVGGYGLWWVPDDLAKLSTFLNNDQGKIDGNQILDPDQLRAALQQNSQDRGVVRDGDGRYNNAFWADEYTSLDGKCRFWVPHMYGYSGIVVALIPNGTAYYYASDNQEFTTAQAIQASAELIPVCDN